MRATNSTEAIVNADSRTEQLAALNAESRRLHLCEFWSEVKALERVDPPPVWKPHVWRYEEVHPRLLRAADIVPLDQAERRAVVFRNPAFPERIATHPTHYSAYSLYNGGEQATVHRHTANAARIGLVGVGGYTTVEGTKYRLGRGDLVLTPNWTWHDHGNDGTEQNVWFDILDVPLIVHVNGLFFDFDYLEDGVKRPIQSPARIVDATDLTASGATGPQIRPSSPYFYPWRVTCEALARHAEVELVNDAGGPAIDSMDIRALRLAPGESTTEMRTSAHATFLVMEGSGETEIDGATYRWQQNDVFYVPNWRWHRHRNADAARPAVLYAITDLPVMRGVGAVRRQTR